ncbi:hypothetical protein EHP00_1028 [Ecytonucleospora hepatopenaei]|uniref:Uncharacterized protein n=1 Tax=Ecytonucleospora hepatopenaei TaxID=646526 RepID=A0A1W0E520_9MICR|nr:hypothetical protein EHP00_1028 [Ecytonucleospora hepatopenaei]
MICKGLINFTSFIKSFKKIFVPDLMAEETTKTEQETTTQNSNTNTSSKNSGNGQSNLKWFLITLCVFIVFIVFSEYIIKSSVFLVTTGLYIAFVLILVSLIAYIFLSNSILSVICFICLLLDCVYMFINRNVVYKVYIRSLRTEKAEKEFLSLFKQRSAVILIYDGNGKGTRYIQSNIKKSPIKEFIASKNSIKDEFKIKVKVKFQPFGTPTGIVKRIVMAIPIRINNQQIKKYKIKVIGD